VVPDALLAWLRRGVAAAISHAADSTPRLRASFTLRSPEQFTQPMHPTQSTQRYGSVIALAVRAVRGFGGGEGLPGGFTRDAPFQGAGDFPPIGAALLFRHGYFS
jgi:hypothetical protein